MKTKTLFLGILVCSVALAGCTVPLLPSKKKINVPFTSQAPAGDWSEPWQNACEETSIYMVAQFYADNTIKRDEAVRDIHEILKIKNEEFKVSLDESLETITNLIDTLGLPWSARVVDNPTVEMLKAELAADRPVIVPVYAPALGASAGEFAGPDYHVFVLTGYDDERGQFIFNDPGSAQGEGRRVLYDTLMDAIHDLNPKNYRAGKKAVLFTHETGWQNWNPQF